MAGSFEHIPSVTVHWMNEECSALVVPKFHFAYMQSLCAWAVSWLKAVQMNLSVPVHAIHRTSKWGCAPQFSLKSPAPERYGRDSVNLVSSKKMSFVLKKPGAWCLLGFLWKVNILFSSFLQYQILCSIFTESESWTNWSHLFFCKYSSRGGRYIFHV